MEIIKNRIKAVIFDMDGTIINTEDIWQKITVDFLQAKGFTGNLAKQASLLESLAGVSLPGACKILKQEFNITDSLEDMIQDHVLLARPYMEKGVNFIGGFKDFHDHLKRNSILTGIATNADLETLSVLTKSMKFENFFGNNIYCMEHVGSRPKPDPAVFLHTATKLNVKPEECLVFEDSKYGFQAAQKAGMKCIAIKNDGNKDLLDLVHGSIDDYSQALEVIKEVVLKK